MTDVQESNMSLGIRLFGATISVKQIRSHGESKNGADDPTAGKRPDKIIPCPRCKSMETKFCYFNNYNVNQPRHFCKGCQRYWTAGGALRNVPVGAGRRKAKPPCPAPSGAGCLFDAGGAQQLDFEEWQAAERGGFEHLFAVKRRRCSDDVGSETCN